MRSPPIVPPRTQAPPKPQAPGPTVPLGCGLTVAFIVAAIYLLGAAAHWLTSTVENFLTS